MSLTGILINLHLPLIILLLNIFKHMCLIYFGVYSNQPLNTVKLTVFKDLRFHENTELIPTGKYYGLSIGNNNPTEGLTLVLVGINIINQLGWLEAAKKDLT